MSVSHLSPAGERRSVSAVGSGTRAPRVRPAPSPARRVERVAVPISFEEAAARGMDTGVPEGKFCECKSGRTVETRVWFMQLTTGSGGGPAASVIRSERIGTLALCAECTREMLDYDRSASLAPLIIVERPLPGAAHAEESEEMDG